jgi:hypothetical protein
MNPDLSWLTGCSLTHLEKKDFTWFFVFGEQGAVHTESAWRLICKDRVSVTSEDHGHQFGLPAPVDAGKVVFDAIDGEKITNVQLDHLTGDLSIDFGGDLRLQFITLSGGFEGWRLVHGPQQIICLGGGGLAVFDGLPTTTQPSTS